ncbi:hypothetical protein C483_07102 [Natrialba hulunbeirensis JCM 10989]|uniref:DUF192 domain-containing protein n=1 Tax=Natrialba hulunbeirensis JCM 10989 TaxID=1227493 RepID=M0A1T2_9EURY|nr:DUF192 domain-containing protein [Natrialba hulunbeirensis]ELY92715.1 hypothetical protein C483_07102 [Natrialba hulunbeirensis JCM 10989]
MSREWSRRHLLGVAGVCAVAGCLDADVEEQPESTDDSETEQSEGDGGNGDSDGDDTADSSGDDNTTTTDDGVTVHGDYELTEVRAEDPDGTELAAVTALIADTPEKASQGLSGTETLPPTYGMLFVFDEVDDHVFYMPEMNYGIDIIYADDEGTITEIHHAPEPGPDEDGADHEYPGRGQYVLEVVYEWTEEHDVSEGDVLAFDLEETVPASS